MTFNDLMLGIISLTLKSMLQEKGETPDWIVTMIPVHLREEVKSLDSIPMGNIGGASKF